MIKKEETIRKEEAKEYLQKSYEKLEPIFNEAETLYINKKYKESFEKFKFLQKECMKETHIIINMYPKLFTGSVMDRLYCIIKIHINKIKVRQLQQRLEKNLNIVISCILFKDSKIKRDDTSLNLFFKEVEKKRTINTELYHQAVRLADEFAKKDRSLHERALNDGTETEVLLQHIKLTQEYVVLLDSNPENPEELIEPSKRFLSELYQMAHSAYQKEDYFNALQLLSEAKLLYGCVQSQYEKLGGEKWNEKQIEPINQLAEVAVRKCFSGAFKWCWNVKVSYILNTLTQSKKELQILLENQIRKMSEFRKDTCAFIAQIFFAEIDEYIDEHIDKNDIKAVSKKIKLGLALASEKTDKQGALLLSTYCIWGDAATKEKEALYADILEEYRLYVIQQKKLDTTLSVSQSIMALFKNHNHDQKLSDLIIDATALFMKCEELVLNESPNYNAVSQVGLKLHLSVTAAFYEFKTGKINKEALAFRLGSALNAATPEFSKHRSTLGLVLNMINSLIRWVSLGNLEGIYGNYGLFSNNNTDSLMKLEKVKTSLEDYKKDFKNITLEVSC